MITEIIYKFKNEPSAYRFMNELKHWSKHEVDAHLHRTSECVIVRYECFGSDFNYASSDLDDLAAKHEGTEV